MSSTRFAPTSALRGSLRPPSDKSISHRAALIAAMGEGETEITAFLDAADTRSTLAVVEAVGAEVRGGARKWPARSGVSVCAVLALRRSTSAMRGLCCGCCLDGWRGR